MYCEHTYKLGWPAAEQSITLIYDADSRFPEKYSIRFSTTAGSVTADRLKAHDLEKLHRLLGDFLQGMPQ